MKKQWKRLVTTILCGVLLLPIGAQQRIHTASAEAIAENAIYVAPDASGSGTKNDPTGLLEAITEVKPGQTIYLLEGTYEFSDTVTIPEDNSGLEGQYKMLYAYPGAEVVLDFAEEAFGKRGIALEGSYWHFYGITICNAGDNGMILAGDYNVIELCVFDGNKDSGLQLSRNNSKYTKVEQWPSYNYILNCTSRNNSDPDGEDADGFAPKLTCGEGNVFDGCLAYNNVDDGWDCYAKSATGPIGVVTIINSIAFRNGQTEEGVFTPDSDGNGFKLGGGGIGTPHVVINCLAFENKNCGFTDNNNPSAISLINCTAFNNNGSQKKADFNVYRCKDANAINILAYNAVKNKNTFQNMSANFVLYPAGDDWYTVTEYMSFDTKSKTVEKGTRTEEGLTPADFVAVESPELGTDFHTLWREVDGSINTNGYAMLAADSTYADFSSDDGACGARFGAGGEFVTPKTVELIKSAAVEGKAPVLEEIPLPAETAEPTQTPVPTEAPEATEAPTKTPAVDEVQEDKTAAEPTTPADARVDAQAGNSVGVWTAVGVVIGMAVAATVYIWNKKKK